MMKTPLFIFFCCVFATFFSCTDDTYERAPSLEEAIQQAIEENQASRTEGNCCMVCSFSESQQQQGVGAQQPDVIYCEEIDGVTGKPYVLQLSNGVEAIIRGRTLKDHMAIVSSTVNCKRFGQETTPCY